MIERHYFQHCSVSLFFSFVLIPTPQRCLLHQRFSHWFYAWKIHESREKYSTIHFSSFNSSSKHVYPFYSFSFIFFYFLDKVKQEDTPGVEKSKSYISEIWREFCIENINWIAKAIVHCTVQHLHFSLIQWTLFWDLIS